MISHFFSTVKDGYLYISRLSLKSFLTGVVLMFAAYSISSLFDRATLYEHQVLSIFIYLIVWVMGLYFLGEREKNK